MKIIRIIFGVVCSFCIVFTGVFGYKKIGQKQKTLLQQEYKGIYTIWHIDTFEGGSGSRVQFLLNVCRKFEKQNTGTIFSVVSHTTTSAENAMNNGEVPDIISYSLGIKIPSMVEINCGCRNKGGKIDDKLYAVPWCRGGYALISKASDNIDISKKNFETIIVSQNTFTQPLISLLLSDITANEVILKKPLDAYIEFVNSKNSVFLATQRDLVRLANRGIEINSRPLTSFNDLYQYVSITTKQKQKLMVLQQFINYLVSNQIQSNLNSIDMMSEYTNVLSENIHISNLQNTSAEKTLSAFTDNATLLNLQQLSLRAVNGDLSCKDKIKKMLI